MPACFVPCMVGGLACVEGKLWPVYVEGKLSPVCGALLVPPPPRHPGPACTAGLRCEQPSRSVMWAAQRIWLESFCSQAAPYTS